MRSHRLFHVVRIKNVLMDTVHKNGKNIMFTKLNQLLLISTILLLVSSPSKAKIDEEKKGKAEGGGNEVFRIGGSPRQHWAWFSPVLLDQYWHTSPFATPTYSLNADESKFELTYKIEGYGKDEIDVELSPNGNLLHIKGEKAQEDCGHRLVNENLRRLSSALPESGVIPGDDVEAEIFGEEDVKTLVEGEVVYVPVSVD